MANFPTSLPSFSNPTASDYLNSPAHHTPHSSVNDEVAAMAAKVGITSSAVTTSHDYKLSEVTTTAKAVSTGGTQTVSGDKTFSGTSTFSGAVNFDSTVDFDSTSQFDAAVTFNKATKSVLVTDSDGATVTFDLDAGNIHTVTLGGNRILALSNPDTGQAFVLRLVQDGTGSRTVTWFSTIRWAGGTAPTLTTTASKADVFGFICTGSNTYDGFIVGQSL